MQKINIDEIIEELKKMNEWKAYQTYLVDSIFYEKNTLLGLFKKGNIASPSSNPCKWEDREKSFPIFKTLEIAFIKLFLKKAQFCPYCGKHSLISYENVDKESKRFFDLDHIFPKNSYQMLTYNFYNLIPSCKLCNQAKGTKNFINSAKIGDKIFHPYFGYIIKQDGRKYENKFRCIDDTFSLVLGDTHGVFFHLDKIYLNSQDTKNDILFIRESQEKILATKSIFKLKSDNEIKGYFFKNYAPEKEEEILKFSNGKLKKDLIEKLKI